MSSSMSRPGAAPDVAAGVRAAFPDLCRRIVAEIDGVLAAIEPDQVAALVEAILAARRTFVYGAGRGGLVMRGLAMRLMHLGLPVAVVGEMTTPPIGPSDVLLVNSAKGAGPTIEAIARAGRAAGATLAVITAQPQAAVPALAERVLVLPAQTLADAEGSRSFQPMGSAYEQALWVLCDALAALLQTALGQDAETMRARHTNLE
ncbi:MAG TPA: 6-phospho-3-hexuloisomerase [Caldilineaceae bacterium]|nr:6-phospho-3-hexuloisomerase [Caldilineaceae bacterium]